MSINDKSDYFKLRIFYSKILLNISKFKKKLKYFLFIFSSNIYYLSMYFVNFLVFFNYYLKQCSTYKKDGF